MSNKGFASPAKSKSPLHSFSQYNDTDDFLTSINTYVKKNEKGLKEGSAILFLNPACLDSLNMLLSGKRVSYRVPKSDLLDLQFMISLVMHLKLDSNIPEVLEKYKELDLIYFKSLQILELHYVKPALITNLYDISKTLTKITIHRSLYSLDELVVVEDEVKLPHYIEVSQCTYELTELDEILHKRFQDIYKRNDIWTALRVLDLSFNFIPKIDHSAYSLTTLEKLNLEGNLISKIENLHECISLRMLNLSFNSIVTTDGVFEVLGCITHLSLGGNQLTSVEGLNKLYGLEYLDVSRNRIKNVEDIFKLKLLPHLDCLVVENNPFCELKLYRGLILCSFFEDSLETLETREFYLDNSIISLSDQEFIKKYCGAKHGSMGSLSMGGAGGSTSTSGSSRKIKINNGKIKPMGKEGSTPVPTLIIAPNARISKEAIGDAAPSSAEAHYNSTNFTPINNGQTVVGSVDEGLHRTVDLENPNDMVFEDEIDTSGYQRRLEDKFAEEKNLKKKIEELRKEGGNAWLRILNEMSSEQQQKQIAIQQQINNNSNNNNGHHFHHMQPSSSQDDSLIVAKAPLTPIKSNNSPSSVASPKKVIVKKTIKKIKKPVSTTTTTSTTNNSQSTTTSTPQPIEIKKPDSKSSSPSTQQSTPSSTSPPNNNLKNDIKPVPTTTTTSTPSSTPTPSSNSNVASLSTSPLSKSPINDNQWSSNRSPLRPQSVMLPPQNSSIKPSKLSSSSDDIPVVVASNNNNNGTKSTVVTPSTNNTNATPTTNNNKSSLEASLKLANQNSKLLCEPFFVVKYSTNQDLLLEIKSDLISETHPTTGNSILCHLLTTIVFVRKYSRSPNELVEITYGKEFKDGVPVEFTKEVYIMEDVEQSDLLLSVVKPLLKEYTMSCMDCTERYTCREEYEFTQCIKCHSRFLFFVPQTKTSAPMEVSAMNIPSPQNSSLSSTPTYLSQSLDLSKETDDDFNFRIMNDQNLQLYFRMNLFTGGSRESYVYMLQSNHIRYNTQEEERPIFILLTSLRVYLLKRQSKTSGPDQGFQLVESYSFRDIRRVSVGMLYQFFRLELEDVCYVFLKRSHDSVHKFLDLLFDAARQESIQLDPYFKSSDTLNNITQTIQERKENFELYIMLHQKISSKNQPRSLIITKEKIYICQENFIQYPLLNNFIKTTTPQFTVIKAYRVTDVSSINIQRTKPLELTIIFEVEGESKQQWQLLTSHVVENRKIISTISKIWKRGYQFDLKINEQ